MSNGDPVELKRWEFAGGAPGYALREMRKANLSKDAAAKVERAMKRVELDESSPHETDLVRDGVYELRVNADKKWFRLLWGKNKVKLVALKFVVKKQNKLAKVDIDTAVSRLAEHAAASKRSN